MLAYVAEAPVVHVHEEVFSQVVNRYRREAIAHKQIYDDQRMPLLDAARLATVNVLSDWNAVRQKGLGLRAYGLRIYLSVGKFRLAQFIGTYQGFAQQGPVSSLLKRRFYYPEQAGTKQPEGPSGDHEPINYDVPIDAAELK